jgi:hypothetical protein
MKQIRKTAIYLLIIFVQFLMVWLYGLWWGAGIFLTLVAFAALLSIRKSVVCERRYEQEYQEVSLYLEQLLCSYRRLNHAGKALEDCSSIFEENSPMGKAVAEAIHVLMTGEGVVNGDIYEAAFAKIEQHYESRRMGIIHTFLCQGERTGGEIGKSSDILLEDLQLWRNRVGLYQNKKRFIKMECAIASLLALLLCNVSRLLTPDELGVRICDSILYQISTVGIVVLLWYVIALIYHKLSGSWLDVKKEENEKQKEQWEHLYAVLYQTEKKSSVLSTHVVKKVIGSYVKEEFPYWILLLTLFLQTESSYQALRSSMEKYAREKTGFLFQKEIEKLTEKIYDSPRDLAPYLDFFAPLSLPEVQTGMKILYSVSAGGYEDSKEQLDFLVAQNNRLMDQSERIVQNHKTAGMSLLKQLPMLAASLKLLVDLMTLLAMTMQGFQSVRW